MSALKPENFGRRVYGAFFCPPFEKWYVMLILKPVTFKQANEFVKQYHRHNTVSQGCKFCVGVTDEAGGGCMVLRYAADRLQDAWTMDIRVKL